MIPRIAYLVLCHRDPDHTIRLIDRLEEEGSFFVVHVDRRSGPDVINPLRAFASQRPSKVFFTERYRCYWGNFGIVKATIACIREALVVNIPFDYAVLLSGQDYPLKNRKDIAAFLSKNNGTEFIESFPLDQPNRWSQESGFFSAMNRVQCWTVFIRSHAFHLKAKRKLPYGWTPYGGSQWWMLTCACVRYLERTIREKPSIVRYFRWVFIPDESFFQSLVSNSPFREKVANENFRYVDWENPNPAYPRTLDVADFETLCATGKLFGRKFDSKISEELLEKLDAEIDISSQL